MKTTVIHHSADYDGIFCREIARKFLPPDTEFVGWDFGNPQVMPYAGRDPSEPLQIYIFDLPVDKPLGIQNINQCPSRWFDDMVWIDHHKSAIESHPKDIPGYRIDGVAACRLAWQWFSVLGYQGGSGNDKFAGCFPTKQDFIDRKVSEPRAILLAGEYDVWDCRPCNSETGL
jgi:hypothetical protein